MKSIGKKKQTIIAKENNFVKRKIKEALCIHTFDDGTLKKTDTGTPINNNNSVYLKYST